MFLLSGCQDFLTVEKYGPSTVWNTEDDVRGAVAALFSNVSNDSEGMTGRGIMWFECCSDNITVGRPQAQAEEIRNFRMSPSNGRDAKDVWPNCYKINAKANNLIKLVPGMDISESYKNDAVGTAYFMRGLAMLWIAPYYGDAVNGGIPIILDTTEPNDMDIPRPASVLENYKQIIADFQKAGELLPLFSERRAEDYGLPHKAAAWGFAARAALYAAEYDKEFYNVVIEMCDKVMSLTGADQRALFDDGTDDTFHNLWRKEQNFGCEYLFNLLGNPTDGPKFHGMSFENGGWKIYNTWGYFQPTYGLYAAYPEGDIRRDATILFPGDEMQFVGSKVVYGGMGEKWTNAWWGEDGGWFDPYFFSISSDSGMTFRKFMSPWEKSDCVGKEVSTNGNNASNTLGMCLLRYADVMLMKAEALIWRDGEGNSETKALLNQIRKRARLPQDSKGDWEDLKLQRRLELAFEFMPSRHIDLIRWGDAKEVYAQPTLKVIPEYNNETKEVTTTVAHYDEGRTFDPEKDHVFAIPAAAFDGTVNLTQNKGF